MSLGPASENLEIPTCILPGSIYRLTKKPRRNSLPLVLLSGHRSEVAYRTYSPHFKGLCDSFLEHSYF